MMRAQRTPRSLPLYFRRWSRLRAAAFRSIGRTVVIGHLTTGVLVRLERKTMRLVSLSGRVAYNETPMHSAHDELPPLLEQVPVLVCQPVRYLSQPYCAVIAPRRL